MCGMKHAVTAHHCSLSCRLKLPRMTRRLVDKRCLLSACRGWVALSPAGTVSMTGDSNYKCLKSRWHGGPCKNSCLEAGYVSLVVIKKPGKTAVSQDEVAHGWKLQSQCQGLQTIQAPYRTAEGAALTSAFMFQTTTRIGFQGCYATTSLNAEMPRVWPGYKVRSHTRRHGDGLFCSPVLHVFAQTFVPVMGRMECRRFSVHIKSVWVS